MKRVSIFAAGVVVLAGAAAAHAELAYATTQAGVLISFDTTAPATTIGGVAVSGMAANEVVQAIDFRPADSQLYALGSFGNIYRLNTATGAATLVAAVSGATLNGSNFGMDFNPTVDRMRVVSDTNQNLRVNPTGGAATVDGPISYAAGDANFGTDPDLTHVAYTNSFAGAASTTLYGIDTDRDVLVTINPPNNGTMNTVGALGGNFGARGGFDISGITGTAYFVGLPVGESASNLYTVNLATGAVTLVGQIDGGVEIRSFAVVPTPGAAALVGLGALAVGRRRR